MNLKLHQLFAFLVPVKKYHQSSLIMADLKVMNLKSGFKFSIKICYLYLWLLIHLIAYLVYYYCLETGILIQTNLLNQNFN
jgi:hypothetical protein